MLKIKENGQIFLPRGDTGCFVVRKHRSGETVPFEAGDSVTFTVKRRVGDKIPIIQKVVTDFQEDGTALVLIEPADTEMLAFGAYWYDIQFDSADGAVDTLIKPSVFVVGEEVTYGSV